MQLLHSKLDKMLFGMAGADMLPPTPAGAANKRGTLAKQDSVSA